MSSMISSGLSALGSVYLWSKPIAKVKGFISSLFKPVSKSEDFDEEFNRRVIKIFDKFLKENNLDANLKICQMWTGHIMGTKTTFNENKIIVLSNLLDTDEEAFKFLFKHEISHVKGNDSIKAALLNPIFSISSVFFLRHYCGLSFIPAVISYRILKYVFEKRVAIFVATFFERKADNFAINNSTIDELKGGLRMVYAEKELLTIPTFHPTPSSRKKALEAALEKVGIRYVPSSEEFEGLIKLLKKNQENSIASKLQEMEEKK